MNLPDDFEIIYPNMIMNNHISLGSSTNDFFKSRKYQVMAWFK